MTEHTALQNQISRFFVESLNVDVENPDLDLVQSRLLDSLGFVELVLNLEKEFGMAINTDDLEIDNFRTIARITEFVSSRNGS